VIIPYISTVKLTLDEAMANSLLDLLYSLCCLLHLFSIKLTLQCEEISYKAKRKKKSTAEKTVALFGFQAKDFYVKHACQEGEKNKIILTGHTTCGFRPVFCYTPL